MAAAAVPTLDITGTTHSMAGFVEWNDPTSRGVSPENTFTRLGDMGPCMYSTSARVTWAHVTSRRYSKVGKIIVRI